MNGMKHKKLASSVDNETGCKKSKISCKPNACWRRRGAGHIHKNIILFTCAKHPKYINTVDT